MKDDSVPLQKAFFDSLNALVQSWPEIVKLAGQKPEQAQEEMF